MSIYPRCEFDIQVWLPNVGAFYPYMQTSKILLMKISRFYAIFCCTEFQYKKKLKKGTDKNRFRMYTLVI